MTSPNSRPGPARNSQAAVLALVMLAGVTRAELAEVVRAIRQARRRQNPRGKLTELLVKVAPW